MGSNDNSQLLPTAQLAGMSLPCGTTQSVRIHISLCPQAQECDAKQAWVFAAFDDEERAPIYYTNAFVYLLPWLSRGFELDRFSIACLLVGIAHVQVLAPGPLHACLLGGNHGQKWIKIQEIQVIFVDCRSMSQVERIAQTEPETVKLPSPNIIRKPLEKAAALLVVIFPACRSAVLS